MKASSDSILKVCFPLALSLLIGPGCDRTPEKGEKSAPESSAVQQTESGVGTNKPEDSASEQPNTHLENAPVSKVTVQPEPILPAGTSLEEIAERVDEVDPVRPQAVEPRKRRGPVPTTLDPGDSGLPTIDLVGLPEALRYDVVTAFEAAKAALNSATALGELGMYYYAADSPLAAIPCFERAASIEPSSLRWWYYLGLSFLGAYDAERAEEAFTKAAATDEKYAPVLVELAELKLRRDVNAAQPLFERVLAVNPQETRALVGLAECKIEKGDYEAARALLKEALNLAPKYAAAHVAMTTVLQKLGQEDEARAHQEETKFGGQPPLTSDPLLVELLSRSGGGQDLLVLAERLARAGQISQAISMLQQAIDRNESDLGVRHALGVLLSIRGRYVEAISEFRTVLKKNPYQFSTLVELSRALMRLGAYAEAEQLLREVLSTSTSDTRAIMLYGSLLMNIGKSEDAVRYFQKLVQTRPDYADVHWELAKAYTVDKKYDPAAQSYRKYTQLAGSNEDTPRKFVWEMLRIMVEQRRAAGSGVVVDQRLEPAVLTNLARSFDAQALPDAAAAARDYEGIIARGSSRLARRGAFLEAERIARLGLPANKTTQEPTIVRLLRQELSDTPDDPGVRHLLALILAASGDGAAAGSEWRQLIRLRPEFELPYAAWGIHLLSESQHKTSEELFRSGLKVHPESIILRNALAWLLATTPDDSIRNPEEAIRLAEEACKQTGFRDAELLDTLAASYAASGNFREATRFEQEAIKAATQVGLRAALVRYRERLILYEKGLPYREARR